MFEIRCQCGTLATLKINGATLCRSCALAAIDAASPSPRHTRPDQLDAGTLAAVRRVRRLRERERAWRAGGGTQRHGAEATM